MSNLINSLGSFLLFSVLNYLPDVTQGNSRNPLPGATTAITNTGLLYANLASARNSQELYGASKEYHSQIAKDDDKDRFNSSQFISTSSVGETAITQENPISAATAAITNTGVLYANPSSASNSQQLEQAKSLIYFYNHLPIKTPRFHANPIEQADYIRSWLKQSPEVQKCTRLQLSKQGLRNLPPEICYFRNLNILDLTENNLETIPAEIGNLKALTHLELDYNRLKDLPAEIENLQALTRLSLSSNWFEAIPPQIGNLPALIYCSFRNNQLQVVLQTPPIGNFQALRILDLAYNQLKAIPDWIGNLSSLISLSLANNQIESIPACIGNLPSLTNLSLANNQIEFIPACIGNLSSLTSLSLGNNQIEFIPACIGNLPLTHLFLQNNKLHAPDAIPPQLGIGNLQTLTCLNLDGNQLREIPIAIGNFQALRSLRLENNKLSDLPAWISNLHALTTLYLKDNDFQTVPTSIQNLPNLRQLYLGSNWLHPTIPVWIGNLDLDHIGLEKNQLSSLPHSLFNLSINSVVYAWDGNQFNETFVNQFLQDLQTHQAANPGQGPRIEIAANFLGYSP